jgi:hypothetical protein
VLKKLQLKLADAYEICVAAEKVAGMVVKFALGNPHVLMIGCEQGDIPAWDDLILLHADKSLEHIQIKRNFTQFSDYACDRNTDPISKGDNKGNLRNLSPLDDSLASLAIWSATHDPATATPKRKFRIELPAPEVLIKRGLEVRQLYEFSNSISTSTTAASLTQAETVHLPTRNIFLWLNTWCGFSDWEHILQVFRHLKVEFVGTESSINRRAEEILAFCFNEPEKVRKAINGFITENSTYTSQITPRPLLGELRPFWLPELKLWAQYINKGLGWDVGGICDPDFGHIERAEKVVSETWNEQKPSELKLHCQSPRHEPLPSALRRLILHMPGTSMAYIHDLAGWRERTLALIGGTLGKDEEDCSALPLVELGVRQAPADIREIANSGDADSEGRSLDRQMDDLTWAIIKNKITEKLLAIPAGELRSAMEGRWECWLAAMEVDTTARTAFSRQMLVPHAEGKGIAGSLRHGPKTALLIAKGIILLLAVAVAVSANDEGWQKLSGTTVSTRAIQVWSGPADDNHTLRKLTDEGIEVLIGREPFKLLILSAVESSISEITGSSLTDGQEPSYTLADGHQPMILTHSGKIKEALRKGDLDMLRTHLLAIVAKIHKIQQEQLKNIAP